MDAEYLVLEQELSVDELEAMKWDLKVLSIETLSQLVVAHFWISVKSDCKCRAILVHRSSSEVRS